MTISFVTWSSTGSWKGRDVCQGRAHIFHAENGHAYGTVCRCGKKQWKFVKCRACGRQYGIAVPVKLKKS